MCRLAVGVGGAQVYLPEPLAACGITHAPVSVCHSFRVDVRNAYIVPDDVEGRVSVGQFDIRSLQFISALHRLLPVMERSVCPLVP